jgi:Na+/melibiose symporter-like transporter
MRSAMFKAITLEVCQDLAMPNDVKAIVSVIAFIVAYLFARWEAASGKPHLYWVVIGLAMFAVAAMWIFPEAGVKKGDVPEKKRET